MLHVPGSLDLKFFESISTKQLYASPWTVPLLSHRFLPLSSSSLELQKLCHADVGVLTVQIRLFHTGVWGIR